MDKNLNAQYDMTKVPEITFYFWIVKILTTAMGESTSDYLVFHINPFVAVVVGGIGFVVALALQFRARRYIAWVYWFTVLMVAVFGTMAADVLHVVLGVPYLISTASFALALAIIFVVWYASEKTLSIHSIYTVRREIFYWATVSATFALGTATGDLTATTLRIGYFLSGIMFTVLIVAVGASHYITRLRPGTARKHQSRDEVLTFWLAYILTRPLGASFADWMGKPLSWGGLAWGDGTVSFLLFVPIFCFVWYLARSRRDVQPPTTITENESELAYPAK
ncbi:MAG: hypothetical protein M1469_07165 [Bacteroidetes bacterium]|nr:hypothetical protein [Bacteroidota bacterium]